MLRAFNLCWRTPVPGEFTIVYWELSYRFLDWLQIKTVVTKVVLKLNKGKVSVAPVGRSNNYLSIWKVPLCQNNSIHGYSKFKLLIFANCWFLHVVFIFNIYFNLIFKGLNFTFLLCVKYQSRTCFDKHFFELESAQQFSNGLNCRTS